MASLLLVSQFCAFLSRKKSGMMCLLYSLGSEWVRLTVEGGIPSVPLWIWRRVLPCFVASCKLSIFIIDTTVKSWYNTLGCNKIRGIANDFQISVLGDNFSWQWRECKRRQSLCSYVSPPGGSSCLSVSFGFVFTFIPGHGREAIFSGWVGCLENLRQA